MLLKHYQLFEHHSVAVLVNDVDSNGTKSKRQDPIVRRIAGD
jgi:hypothetical protein